MHHRLRCSEVWGGIRDVDVDACSATVDASLLSTSCDGAGKGGDIYYFSVCAGDDLTRIVLADVAGHGTSVSDVSAWLYQSMLRAMNTIAGDRVLSDLNDVATERGMSALTTAAVAGFYRSESTLYLAYAGHHPVLLLRGGAARWRPEAAAAGLPLGALAEAEFAEQPVRLSAGDRIAMYTDGLIEAPSPSGEMFGSDRLRAALDANARASLPRVKQGVIDSVRRHTGGSLAHDDVTLLLAELR